MRALLINIKLDICKINHMEIDRAGITCYQISQVNYLLLCSLTGVWRRMEINSVDLNTSLCDHITCNRAVNTTGKQQHCLTIGTDRHTTRSRDHQGEQVYLLTDLHTKENIRMMYIYLHLWESI